MWTTEDSDKLYHISKWGSGFFSINDSGNLTINPESEFNKSQNCIDIMDIVEEIKALNLKMPIVLRFQDILSSQITKLNKAFQSTIEEANYQGRYSGVFPIKVNQLREVVEEIVEAGAPFDYGLEAGSKPELLAVLAHNSNRNSLTICNGYKDRDYLKLALLGRKIGKRVIIVVEKFSELGDIVDLAKEMDVEPLIGIRAKLSAKSSGKWSASGGENAKFGLSIPEIVQAANFLRENGMEESLKLFHFHIGSQIPDILTFKDAITEGARIYAKLIKMGMGVEYFDVGGGLGVDYDGSRSIHDSSINYDLKDYAEDIVYILKQTCEMENVPHPNIVTESGRAVTAHHSCIITNVFGRVNATKADYDGIPMSNEHVLVQNMRELLTEFDSNKLQEIHNDALQFKEQTLNAFKLGILSLEERASVETLYQKIRNRIALELDKLPEEEIPEGLLEISNTASSQYLCNFSLFQSAPDSWAISQLFPIAPLHRLNEEPTEKCTLADITCDSDGTINQFISGMTEPDPYIELHSLRADEDYYMGIFLTGAYQDILGDLHNLFGRVTEIHVYSDPLEPKKFYIEEVIRGSRSNQILELLQYNTEAMTLIIKKELEKQSKANTLRKRESVQLTNFYEQCLKDHTYLNNQK